MNRLSDLGLWLNFENVTQISQLWVSIHTVTNWIFFPTSPPSEILKKAMFYTGHLTCCNAWWTNISMANMKSTSQRQTHFMAMIAASWIREGLFSPSLLESIIETKLQILVSCKVCPLHVPQTCVHKQWQHLMYIFKCKVCVSWTSHWSLFFPQNIKNVFLDCLYFYTPPKRSLWNICKFIQKLYSFFHYKKTCEIHSAKKCSWALIKVQFSQKCFI